MKDSRFSRGSRGSVVQAESAIVRVASRCAANSAGGSDLQAAGAFGLRADFAEEAVSGGKAFATASATHWNDSSPSGRSSTSIFLAPPSSEGSSGVGKTRRVGLSGAVARLVVAVPCVTRQVSGRRVRALGMICLRVCGGAGLAPAAGLIRSLSASLA